MKAREEFSANSSLQPQMLGNVTPPRKGALPQVVEPYSKREMRQSVLGYDFLDSDFPVIPERDERRQKWITLVATLVILIVIGTLITRPWSAERPSLIDPNGVEETIDE